MTAPNPMSLKTTNEALFSPQDFEQVYRAFGKMLIDTDPIKNDRWQSIDVSESKAHDMHELLNVNLHLVIPYNRANLHTLVSPSTPWADDHFSERIGGKPTNPGDTYASWPWYKGGVEDHKSTGQFSHTYMERYWPKEANGGGIGPEDTNAPFPHQGIRYEYGDLNDVVNLLVSDRNTRQAFLPVWFPEDTGAVHGERVPCSIGYHFIIRNNRLHCFYTIRSCDFVRYLRDDIYLTGRLMQWVCTQYNRLTDDPFDITSNPMVSVIHPGELVMNISSLHCFRGDDHKLREIIGAS
jgi:hypothetical protein